MILYVIEVDTLVLRGILKNSRITLGKCYFKSRSKIGVIELTNDISEARFFNTVDDLEAELELVRSRLLKGFRLNGAGITCSGALHKFFKDVFQHVNIIRVKLSVSNKQILHTSKPKLTSTTIKDMIDITSSTDEDVLAVLDGVPGMTPKKKETFLKFRNLYVTEYLGNGKTPLSISREFANNNSWFQTMMKTYELPRREKRFRSIKEFFKSYNPLSINLEKLEELAIEFGLETRLTLFQIVSYVEIYRKFRSMEVSVGKFCEDIGVSTNYFNNIIRTCGFAGKSDKDTVTAAMEYLIKHGGAVETVANLFYIKPDLLLRRLKEQEKIGRVTVVNYQKRILNASVDYISSNETVTCLAKKHSVKTTDLMEHITNHNIRR